MESVKRFLALLGGGGFFFCFWFSVACFFIGLYGAAVVLFVMAIGFCILAIKTDK